MASAWGKSWGTAWGNAWGVAEFDEQVLFNDQALTSAAPKRMRITPKLLPYPQAKAKHRTRAQREKEFPVFAT